MGISDSSDSSEGRELATEGVHIRWMMRRDLPEVLAIDGASYAHRLTWSEDTFIDHLRSSRVICMVAEVNEKVVGFMVHKLHKGRIELLRLAVAQAWRRRRIGSRLVSRLVRKTAESKRTSLVAAVRESDLAGQLFLRACGLRCEQIIQDLYREEHGYRFEVDVRRLVTECV